MSTKDPALSSVCCCGYTDFNSKNVNNDVSMNPPILKATLQKICIWPW